MKHVAAILLSIFLFVGCAFADPVTLAWDAPTDSVCETYKLYWGSAPNSFDNNQDVGNVLEATIDIPPGSYIAATCLSNDLESDYSNPVFYGDTQPLQPAINLSAIQNCDTGGGGDVAVARTGSIYTSQSSDIDTSISSIIIPSDANICVVINEGGSSQGIDGLCWDAGNTLDFTLIVRDNPWEFCEAWYMTSADGNWPGSGSGKTLSIYRAGAIGEGQNLIVLFYKNVDISGSPIVDTDTYNADSAGVDISFTLSGVAAGDMSIGASYTWDSNAYDAAPAGSGQTAVWEASVFNNNGLVVAEEVGESSIEIDNVDYPRAISFALKAAAGGGPDYTLTSANGSYSITGSAADLVASRALPAATASYALTGQDAAIGFIRLVDAQSGGYALTGNDAALINSRRVVALNGSYIITGNDPALKVSREIVAENGSYVLVGRDAALGFTRLVAAESGSYVLSGQAAGLDLTRLVSASSGTYALTGQPASLVSSRYFVATNGTYVLTGQDATLTKSDYYIITASPGTLLMTGNDTGLIASRKLEAAGGSYNVSGNAAGLLASRKLIAENNGFLVTGNDSILVASRVISAAYGNYVITGQDAALLRSGGYSITASPGAYTLSGSPVSFVLTRIGFPGDFVIAAEGIDANLLTDAGGAEYILYGQDALSVSIVSVPQLALILKAQGIKNIYVVADNYEDLTITEQSILELIL